VPVMFESRNTDMMSYPMMGLLQGKYLMACRRRLLSRNTRTIRRGRASCCCNRIKRDHRFMLYGVSQRVMTNCMGHPKGS